MNALSAAGVLCLGLVCFLAAGAEPEASPQDLPRFAPVSPDAVNQTFQFKDGFHLELVASEPNLASPVAVSFDENGRMFVVEMVDYSERREQIPHLGRIRLLEDLDGDGVYEKSTIFATNLAWPTAVFCCNGGVFVAATPDILYLKDSDGDGKADVREVVFTGFADGVERINVQEMLNSFVWGLDNRIHGATSGEGGHIRSLRHPESKVLDLRGRDFAIDPQSLTMTSEAGGGQHGLSFDDIGRRFTCNNSDHLRLFMYDDAYEARNPLYTMPAPLISMGAGGPAAEVFRISPDEPWRVLRTRWRVGGLVPGPIEGGGRPSGYFTGATGVTLYRGDAYPEEFRGNVFVADCAGNLIHRELLIPDGVSLKGERPSNEQKLEFIASRDTWFRPVQFASAPDGTLYVIDMYREIVEHPWSLPEGIKKRLDLNSGSDRGRIYRIAPNGFKPTRPPHLGNASTSDLVGILEHRNGWHRDTAARLLYERQDQTAVALLSDLFGRSHFELARLHALYVLQGLHALTETTALAALNDPSPAVRMHAVKLSEQFVRSREVVSPLSAKLRSLAADSSIQVRYQLAFTLGEIPDQASALAAIVRHDVGDSWMRAAVLSSLGHGAAEVFSKLTEDERFCGGEPGREFLRDLVIMIGARNDSIELGQVQKFIDQIPILGLRFGLVYSLVEGLKRAGKAPGTLLQQFKTDFAAAALSAGDAQAEENSRLAAIQLLGLTTFAESGSLLLSLLEQPQPQFVQLAAVASLNRYDDPRLASGLIKLWTGLSPRLRSETVSTMLARPERAGLFLKAMQAGSIQPSVLSTGQQKFLKTHRDKNVRELAGQVLDRGAPSSRQGVLEAFAPALKLSGDKAAGKKIYEERCFSCHRLAKEGNSVGPDLAAVKSNGKDKLLVNILDPNREVAPQFVSYVIETREGDSYVGLLVNETSNSITVRQPYGKENVIARAAIASLRSQAQSLMPEGLEAGLSPQGLADLLEFIETADQ